MPSLIPSTLVQKRASLKSTTPRCIAWTLLLSVLVLACVLLHQPTRDVPEPDGRGEGKRTALTTHTVSMSPATPMPPARAVGHPQPQAQPTVAGTPRGETPTLPPQRRASSPAHRSKSAEQIIDHMAHMARTQAPVTPQQAEEMAWGLDQLVAQGRTAVPAIQVFLQGLKDMPLVVGERGGRLGPRTLRLALIDTLDRIGGPEAEQALLEELQMTADPDEIAALADVLEQQAPGLYRDPILRAAHETLAVLSQRSRGQERTDIAPLFGVLQRYGDASVAVELERGPSWFKPSATVTLASLTDGQGLPYLIRMVQKPTALETEPGRLALQMLVQLAVDHPEAQEAVLDQVRLDTIPASLWPRLAEVSAGKFRAQMVPPARGASPRPIGSALRHNPYSTYTIVSQQIQTIYFVHQVEGLSSEEVNRRLELIDRLSIETANPVARDALDHARTVLVQTDHRF